MRWDTCKAVKTALASGGGCVTRDSDSSVRFALRNGRLLRGHARIEEDWITIAAGEAGKARIDDDPDRLWSRLVENGKLAGTVRFAVGPSGEEMLRADIPVEGHGAFEGELADTCRYLKEACAKRRRARDAEDGYTAPSADEVGRLFEDSPWEIAVKNEQVNATLDIPGNFVQARLTPRGPDTFRATAQLQTVAGEVGAQRRHAIGLFLLLASNAGRLVRPAVHPGTGRTRITCDVEFRTYTSPARELGRALSALSVSVGMCRREIKALNHEAVGAAYLAVRAAGGNGRESQQHKKRR